MGSHCSCIEYPTGCLVFRPYTYLDTATEITMPTWEAVDTLCNLLELKKSADQKDANAAFQIAVTYHRGLALYDNTVLIKKDHTKAMEYYTIAADQGHAKAMIAIVEMKQRVQHEAYMAAQKERDISVEMKTISLLNKYLRQFNTLPVHPVQQQT